MAQRGLRDVGFELLEKRAHASASYVAIGHHAQPVVTSGTAVYFSKALPAGDYLVAFVGGSLSYKDTITPLQYRVNDYGQGDFGYKIAQPNVAHPIDAPGSSVLSLDAKTASTQSAGLVIKFRHSAAGRIGIYLYDAPYTDNVTGRAGAPNFILKQRVVHASPAVSKTVVVQSSATSFSAEKIITPDSSLQSLLD